MKRTGILLLALLLFGCVKTPDTEPIVSKADGALEQAIAASPVRTGRRTPCSRLAFCFRSGPI